MSSFRRARRRTQRDSTTLDCTLTTRQLLYFTLLEVLDLGETEVLHSRWDRTRLEPGEVLLCVFLGNSGQQESGPLHADALVVVGPVGRERLQK